MLDKLAATDFSPYLGQRFLIHAESLEPLKAELIEVTELGSATADANATASEMRRAFSIVLRGPKDPYLPQRIYRVEHKEIEGPCPEGKRYCGIPVWKNFPKVKRPF